MFPKYGTITSWMAVSGDSRRTTYAKIADGRLLAVKDGRRTKIDIEDGLKRMAELPPAKIRMSPRATRRLAESIGAPESKTP